MMFNRFSREAREVVVRAQQESAALRHHYIGTEHLVLALAAEPDSGAGRLLARWGVTAEALRSRVAEEVGTGQGDIDPGALAILGIDLDEVRRRVEATFGPGALSAGRGARRGKGVCGSVPFTPRAKKTLELALREAVALGNHHIGPEHVLLGILREGQGVGARFLAERGVTRAGVVSAVTGADRLAG